ncbi:hypothetical protein ACWF7H_19870 [Peribacillus butanolivorans]|uniref:hypothetical protein n=1 Tax=Peribacillus butanolivorans TaxID=421767 RepID=UPI003695B82E
MEEWQSENLVIGQAGWLSGIPYFDIKMKLPKMMWEDAMTANELRNRVYELRFPSRMLEIGDDQASKQHFLILINRLIKLIFLNSDSSTVTFAL